jgi:hypothetical protein
MNLLHRPIPEVKVGEIPQPPRDLMDFHLRWLQFRPMALQIQAREALSGDESRLLGWLIALSDRISEQDIL